MQSSSPPPGGPAVDMPAVEQLIEQLESDLDRLQAGPADVQRLREDLQALRRLLAGPPNENFDTTGDVSAGLNRLRGRLHVVTDELFIDAVRSGDYVARIGRLLGW
jgi:hypothetical protein